ncbi:segregation and condensation protein A [Streptomyces sp. enrichment culture]|uniref:segregation and condensation protein A n=1 Tax=Streptomyces sp. enrichment culture TaxID=1795815 RepID=UPI003F56B150
MTSNDAAAPAPGAGPPRRRPLGRGAARGPAAAGRSSADADASTAAGAPAPGNAVAQPEPAAGEAAPAGERGASDGTAAGHGGSDTPLTAPRAGAGERGTVAPLHADVRPSVTAPAPVGSTAGRDAPADDAGVPGGASSPGGASEGEGDGGDGRFKVRLANFEGPFDLLLQLIAKHKLDVTEVALSKVTDEFMAYIRALGPDWDLDETTEFLVVAATLLDLKAARLLPAAEVEDEADLALLETRDLLFARLLQYRAYKQVAEILSRRLDDEARRFPRTVGLEPHHAELLPDVVLSIGPEGFAELAVRAMQPRPEPQVYVDHIHAPLVSVQEQAGIVVARLKELGEAGFRALVEDTDDTLTVVARFLALLELYREKAVALDQESALGELTVRWTGGDGDAVPAVTDEFDRPPEQPQEERTP